MFPLPLASIYPNYALLSITKLTLLINAIIDQLHKHISFSLSHLSISVKMNRNLW